MELDKVYLGDAYNLIKEIPDKSIDLVYVDIPYEIHTTGYGNIGNVKKLSPFSESITKDNLIKGIDYSIFDDFIRVLKKPYMYVWCSVKQIYPIMNYILSKHQLNYQILTWCKTNPVPLGNKQFLDDVEYCLVFYESGVKVNLGVDNKHKWFSTPLNQKDKELYNHPTIKPLEWTKQHILNSSQEGDVVLDCFAGSGTTLVACKELGRHYIGFELDESYYNICVDRLNGITQIKRRELDDGVPQQLELF